MRPIALIAVFFLGCFFGSILAAVISEKRDKAALNRIARQNGFSRGHQQIYSRAMTVLNRILEANTLDEALDPLVRVTTLSASLRREATQVRDDYREELNA